MDLTIAKNDLMPMLARASVVVKKNSPLPILGCVVLTARAGQLHAVASSGDMSVECTAVADVKAAGRVAVKAIDLIDRVKTLPAGPITLRLKERKLLIQAGGSRKHSMPTAEDADFPGAVAFEATRPAAALAGSTLAGLLSRTLFAATPDVAVPSRNGALLVIEAAGVRTFCADTWGMASDRARCSADDDPGEMRALVPLFAAQALAKLLEGSEFAETRIAQGDGRLRIEGAGVTFVTQLANVDPQPFEQVLAGVASAAKTTVTADRAALLDAVRSVSVASSGIRDEIRITLAKGALRIESESADRGSSSDEVPVEGDAGNVAALFTAGNVVQMLASIPDERVTLFFGTDGLQSLRLSGERFEGVLMPLRPTA